MKLFFFGILAYSLTSCMGGARSNIQLNDADFPVSMSPMLFDSNNQPIDTTTSKAQGQFRKEFLAWSIGYSLIPLGDGIDLSSDINSQIKQVSGDSIVNFRVEAQGCGLNYFPILSLLPIWPGCVSGVATGQIMKMQDPS